MTVTTANGTKTSAATMQLPPMRFIGPTQPIEPEPEPVSSASAGPDDHEPGTGSDTTMVSPASQLAQLAVFAIVAGAVLIGGVGFAASFETVTTAMRPSFGDSAWMVPATADLAIVVVSGLDILLSRMRMRIGWLRLIPWSLTAAIIYLNASSADRIDYQIAHALPPALFVVMVEVARHVISVRADHAAGEVVDGPRIPRWVVAPVDTARLWQIMSLEGLSTIDAARAKHEERVLAKVALRTRYGVAWRLRAPNELLAKRRLRTLTAAAVRDYATPAAPKPAAAPKKARTAASSPAAAAPKPTTTKTKTTKTKAAAVSDDDAMAAIRAHLDEGGRISVKGAARSAGIGVDRARRLLDAHNLRK